MARFGKHITLIVVLIAIVAIIGVLELRKPAQSGGEGSDITITDTNERVAMKEKEFERAKEISTPDGFINATEDFNIKDLIGKKVVLVDFWTYSCINCQRTLPYLNAWNKKYADEGLVIIGLHTPEFEFEKNYENVKRAVEKWGIEYPVVLDNDYSTWRAYKNQYWPRKYLIDIDGFIVYEHIGEGGYKETEEKIVALLNERARVLGEGGVVVSDTAPENVDTVDFGKVRSPEMYFGYARVENLVNPLKSTCTDSVCRYEKPATIPLNGFALSGAWNIEREKATLADSSGSVTLYFNANKVNLVAGADGAVRAEIYLDGKKVTENHAGYSVGSGVVEFNEHDLYNLIDLRGQYGAHELEIRFLDGSVSAFAFTFG
ncbi:thiol-disulfide isomerase [Candidatus Kaiserbacteria bacterium CG10_big_fil_rev_8_21_14_0_10_49_17]|uniref:Thiol-disulfide isomerase n=1 Tax=Candidatus Kaiserbacteria bacterium CG10_big_fil_rev_8_21_14_0_10_49_17 TaxID=1974609 RepID=A0A2M6WEM6_9BACT|nr:MAG: thiol-disulfide isomerase [Candidatus Kaiserbacteria bacterium CG10_big_fil_rev_8_21_14_0_10_49_17]